ncbi:hypothetical protein [Caballeronia sp. S22]|uniref:hypothetical protein n=1 Tax=Caballeronia sp. S22 TaxID=3137182 RepID=UPI00353148BF
MNALTLGVASREAISRSFVAAMGGEQRGEFISFGTSELPLKTLTAGSNVPTPIAFKIFSSTSRRNFSVLERDTVLKSSARRHLARQRC